MVFNRKNILPFWVRFHEDLTWSLPKVHNLWFNGMNFLWVLQRIPINWILICKVEETIQTVHCLLSFLFVPKNQVNPGINCLIYFWFFKSFFKFCNIKVRILPRPIWQFHVIDSFFTLHDSKVKFIYIQVNLRNCVKFRQKLPDIWMLSRCIFPRISHRKEQSVSKVKFSSLKKSSSFCERVESDQVMINDSWTWVMSSIMELFLIMIIYC